MACEQPDSGSNHPRNLFVWRSNLLGSSGKGHEYMQKYLLGTESGIQARNSVPATGSNRKKSSGKLRRLKQARPAGDARLPHVQYLPVLRYRSAHRHLVRKRRYEHLGYASVYSSAFCGGRSGVGITQRLGIYKGIAKAFSQVCVGHLGRETDVVLQPLLHDSPAELSQPCEVLDWRKGECDLIPAKPRRILWRWSATTLLRMNALPRSAIDGQTWQWR